MFSVLFGQIFLPAKRVGALFELQQLPFASAAHWDLRDFPERLKGEPGEAHILPDLLFYLECWLVFHCIHHLKPGSQVSFFSSSDYQCDSGSGDASSLSASICQATTAYPSDDSRLKCFKSV